MHPLLQAPPPPVSFKIHIYTTRLSLRGLTFILCIDLTVQFLNKDAYFSSLNYDLTCNDVTFKDEICASYNL